MRLRFLSLLWTVALLGGAAPQDAAKPADVEHGVVPFLTKHCIGCHGPEKKKADLVLHTYKDTPSLLKNRKVWQAVTEMVRSGEMPPTGKPRPTSEEIDGFLKAVRTTFETADRNAKPDPGHVTMRRLNRAEYVNTIRDLVGLEFQADDFPSDDVGHGFDNIGDVLTLSPVLMERYLAAAETIAQRAIVVGEAPRPAPRVRSARLLEPALSGAIADKNKFRSLERRDDTLTATFEVPEPGDHKLLLRVFGKQVGSEKVRFALEVDGQENRTFEVKGSNEGAIDQFDVRLQLAKGKVKLGFRFLNEHTDPKNAEQKRALVVQRLTLEGPPIYPASHRLIMAHQPGLNHHDAAREILARFATRAFRRPATPAEVERLLGIVECAEKAGDSWEGAVQLAVQAVLSSPKFIFRVELDGQPGNADAHALDDYQLASRLSYFVWSSMPDDELFALAAKKELHQSLEPQVKRMLRDPKARALVDNFAVQWLQVRTLRNINPDRKLFPEFDEPLRQAMLKETELFIDAVVREDRSILELIDADFTFLNERLAKHYGIADTKGNRRDQPPTVKPAGEPIRGEKFVRVALQDSERGGVLAQASVLAVTSNPTRTSPVKRGRWILDQILGTPPPPPPPDVPDLAEGDKAELTGSLRQRMEQHRANASCANCHARMDPIGFAFENYDAIGKFRKNDGKFPIDPAGTLPGGQTFNGPGELKQLLKGKKDLFARCLSEKMLTYATGRGLEYYDRATLDRIVATLDRQDYRFSVLVLEIVRSDPFRLRRGKDTNP